MEHKITVWGAPKLPSDLEPRRLSGALPTCSEILEIETPEGVGGRLALSTCFTG